MQAMGMRPCLQISAVGSYPLLATAIHRPVILQSRSHSNLDDKLTRKIKAGKIIQQLLALAAIDPIKLGQNLPLEERGKFLWTAALVAAAMREPFLPPFD